MRSLPVRIRALSLLSALSLGGCATVQTEASPSDVRRFASVGEAYSALSAENLEGGGGPRVRLYVPGAVFSASRYIDTRISVSEDAYVLVVAVDRDRRAHVVFPESPDASGFVSHEKSVNAQRFFAGFGQQRSFGFSYTGYSGYGSQVGNMIAIASDRPLQFERLVDGDGQWDEYALERMLFTGNAPMAAHSLGRLLTLTGQTYDSDYTNFINGQFSSAFSYARGSSCAGSMDYNDFYGSYGAAYDGYGSPLSTPVAVHYSVYNGILYAQYRYVNQCGMPYYSQPVAIGPAKGTPMDTVTIKPDTTKIASGIRSDPGPALKSGSGGGLGIPIRALEENGETKKPLTGYRLPQTGNTGPSVRDGGDSPRAGGLRFRSPEEVPRDQGGSVIHSRGSASGWNPTRDATDQRRIRSNEPVGGEQQHTNAAGGDSRPIRPQAEASQRSEPARVLPPMRSEPPAVRPAPPIEQAATRPVTPVASTP